MKVKDYEPIKFEFFQSDMENIMWFLQEIVEDYTLNNNLKNYAKSIKYDLQHKIEIHMERGEWK
jgi:uncharacterized protein (UPF0147 family)